MSQEEVRIALKNEISEMQRLCECVHQIGKRYNYPAKRVLELNLILEEIVANIINHGFEDNGEHRIDIVFSLGGDDVTVRLADGGIAFNPMQAPAPEVDLPVDKRSIGGLGIVFIHKFSDHVDYRRKDGKNHVTVSKKMV